MKRATAIFFLLLTLLANLGLSVNTHYCGGHAVASSFSMGIHDLACDMIEMDTQCAEHNASDHTITSKCCENAHQVIDLTDNLNSQVQTILKIVSSAVLPCTVLNEVALNEGPDYLNVAFHPPRYAEDLLIRFQRFLI